MKPTSDDKDCPAQKALDALKRWLNLQRYTGQVTIRLSVNQGGITTAKAIREDSIKEN